MLFALCLGLGISAAFWLPVAPWILLGMFALLALFATVMRAPRRRWLLLIVAAGFATLGAFRYAIAAGIPQGDISRLAPAQVRVVGLVASSVTPDHADADPALLGARFILQVRRLITLNGRRINRPVAGSIFVRVPLRDTGETYSRHAPRPGDLIQIDGSLEVPPAQRNPGGFDERQWLADQGVFATMHVEFSFDWRRERPSRWDFGALAARSDALLLSHARASMQPADAQALAGILIGQRAGMPPATRDIFDRTGASHVLATAGLHVGLLALGLLLMVRIVGVPRRAGLLVVISALVLYSQMAGARAAVCRAVILAVLYLGAQVFEREPDAATSLAIAALILLLAQPAALFQVGFQLSFVVVITLALAAPWMEAAVRGYKRRRNRRPIRRLLSGLGLVVGETAIIATSAQVGAAPLTAYYFHQVQTLSIPANTLVVPVVGPVMACASAASLASLITPVVARPFDAAAHLLLVWITGALRLCSRSWWASLGISPPPPLLIAGLYALLWWALWRFRPDRQSDSIAGAQQ
ncbi:MAG: ComEC family competence protein [Armatimonadetes bacterium]|nr:ComEC family competence protein [Armatimonadota bacterium]MDE2208038.1 ComEC family competence protein [Armatimonadota bacterium]